MPGELPGAEQLARRIDYEREKAAERGANEAGMIFTDTWKALNGYPEAQEVIAGMAAWKTRVYNAVR